MAPATQGPVDAYLAAQPAPARAVLQRVRAIILEALPGASEGISYQIPVYKLDGAMVVYFAGFQRHYSLYPATAHVVAALGDELAGSLHSKATVRFPYADRVPARLIARFAKLRAAEVADRTVAKAARRAGPKKRQPAPRATGAGKRARKR